METIRIECDCGHLYVELWLAHGPAELLYNPELVEKLLDLADRAHGGCGQ